MRIRRNSFIKQVMDQVKKDMEADDKLRKDWEQVQKSSDRMRETSAANSEKLEQFGERMKSLSSQTSELLSSWSDKARNVASSTSSRLDRATEDNEALKKAREFVRSASESTSAASSSFLNKTREKFSNATDTSESASMDKAKDAKAAEAEEVQSALVVSQAGSSSWGPRLSDMPFLNSVFENPLFDRVFGETEIAASIREMKELDYTFSTVNAGIKERKKQQMSLDSKILAGPREALNLQRSVLKFHRFPSPAEVELKGAKLMEQGAPCFIWTFNMQQVNCLRDSDGEIIEGVGF
eukprot:g24873.t1